MRTSFEVRLSPRTWARLSVAASETGQRLDHFATMAVLAALRLHSVSPTTTAIPRFANREALSETVAVTLDDDEFFAIGSIADSRNMTTAQLMRAILDASVQSYPPPTEVPKEPMGQPPRRRRQFDPAYYAQHAAVFKGTP